MYNVALTYDKLSVSISDHDSDVTILYFYFVVMEKILIQFQRKFSIILIIQYEIFQTFSQN